jgi:uncharacterized protein (DUF1778 family)
MKRQYTPSVDGNDRCNVRLHVRLTREEVELLEQYCKLIKRSVVSFLEARIDDEKNDLISRMKTCPEDFGIGGNE